MFPAWPLLVYFFITGLGADFQALISSSGLAGIDQAGKSTHRMRSKLFGFFYLLLPCRYTVITLLLRTDCMLLAFPYVLVFGCKTLI